MTTLDQPVVEIDHDKLMAFVFRAIEEVGASLNCALVVMGDRLGYYRSLAEHGPTPYAFTFKTVFPEVAAPVDLNPEPYCVGWA